MEKIDALVEQLTQDETPVQPAPHPYKLGLSWLLGAALYLMISLAVSGMRPDWLQKLQHPWLQAEIVLLVLMCVSTALSAAVLAFPDLHQRGWLTRVPLALFGVFSVVMAFSWQADKPPAPLPIHSFECTLSILAAALLPAVWVMYTLRHYASTHVRWAGSTALLFAFSVGALWLRLHEVNDSVIHVILWHYLPMIAVGWLGLSVGQKWLRW